MNPIIRWGALSLVLIGSVASSSSSAEPRESAPGAAAAPRKFPASTKEEGEEAIRTYKAFGEVVASKLTIKLETLETDHFLVFTDWDPREYEFLRQNVEAAYTAVSRQFDVPRSQNVFVGKLPIFMFAKQKEFLAFATDIDHLPDPGRFAGFYRLNPNNGFHHMAMWKPDIAKARGDVHLAEQEWGYVLTHEFTHAFIARYRTDGDIPRWLNEGTAEVIAYRQFPIMKVYSFVRVLAGNGRGIKQIFEDKSLSDFVDLDYHVSQTVVETMIAGDPKAFLRFVNDIKDGVEPDAALQREYHTDRAGLEQAWRKYLKAVGNKQ